MSQQLEDQDRAAIDRAVLAVLLARRDGLTCHAIARQLGPQMAALGPRLTTWTYRVDRALWRLQKAQHARCAVEQGPYGPEGERRLWYPLIYRDHP